MTGGSPPTSAGEGGPGREWRWYAGLFLLGLLPRVLYAVFLELPAYDPWRHLELVRNLRAGEGFTLFAGQPYIWYAPWWHRLAALLPGAGLLPLATLLSALAVPCFYGVLRRVERLPVAGAAAGALCFALAGPLVRFTCHYGPEALALLAALGALLAASTARKPWAAVLAGLVAGLALTLRLNFAFWLIWIVARARSWPLRLAVAAGATVLPAASWLRNRGIVEEHGWIFGWDGLALDSERFDLVSIFFLQRHPAIAEGLRRLHEQLIPVPEWIAGPRGPAWGLILLMAAGVAALLVSRRVWPLVAGALSMIYLLAFDATLSSNFFRVYLPVLPLLFVGVGALWERRGEEGAASRRPVAVVATLLVLLGGASQFSPPFVPALETVTPPAGFLVQQRYMVNSGFFQPESLIHRYPSKSFIGMPLDPEFFDRFQREFPGFDRVLWHDIGVQRPLYDYLLEVRGYRIEAATVNAAGRRYEVLAPPAVPGSPPLMGGDG